jgi:hypothetical protein
MLASVGDYTRGRAGHPHPMDAYFLFWRLAAQYFFIRALTASAEPQTNWLSCGSPRWPPVAAFARARS